MPETIDNLLKKAQQLEKQNDYKQLADIYRQIATYYHKKKDKVKSEEYLGKSKEAKEKIPVKEVKLSITAEDEFEQIIQMADNEELYRQLERFVERHPKKVLKAYGALADLGFKLGYFEKTRKYLDFILTLLPKEDKPKRAVIYFNYANLLNNEYFKEFDFAKQYFEKAIELNPKFGEAYNNFANLLSNDYFKEYDRARQHLEKAIELNPKSADAYNNLAILLTNDYFKEFDLAKKYFEKAIKLNPKYAEAYNNFAYNLTNDYFKEYDLAKKYFEKAIKLNPQYAVAYINLANLLSNDYFKEYDLAKTYYEKAKELTQNELE